MKDRVKHLSALSGLDVFIRYDEKGTIYVFANGKDDVAAFYTYKKAKAFATGVAYGFTAGAAFARKERT